MFATLHLTQNQARRLCLELDEYVHFSVTQVSATRRTKLPRPGLHDSLLDIAKFHPHTADFYLSVEAAHDLETMLCVPAAAVACTVPHAFEARGWLSNEGRSRLFGAAEIPEANLHASLQNLPCLTRVYELQGSFRRHSFRQVHFVPWQAETDPGRGVSQAHASQCLPHSTLSGPVRVHELGRIARAVGETGPSCQKARAHALASEASDPKATYVGVFLMSTFERPP
mmetsp:Transcript_95965/g.271480  ORF Transcript_95965/g.271480 Transcript_95965/m.271480 type:complete len:227 (+) Transcript_95965:853-1533(+)